MSEAKSLMYPIELIELVRPTRCPRRPVYVNVSQPSQKLLTGYTNFDVRARIDENSNSFFSVRLMLSNDFDDAQRSFLVRSLRLINSYGIADSSCVAGKATNLPRDSTMVFNGRKYTAAMLKEVSDRYGESISMNLALYDCFYIMDFDRDGRDDADAVDYITLKVDRFDEDPDAGIWTLGKAQVNYYGENKSLFIRLNGKAIGASSDYPNSQDRVQWAATIVHEVLHNLGWSHADTSGDEYEKTWIVAYETCMFGLERLFGEVY